MPILSVLICTYNRPEMLAKCLQALMERTVEKPDQVVIVNGGDQRSDEIVQEYADKTNIRIDLVKTVNKNLATSRNVGLHHCTGDIIAWTDDDAEVFPDWVTQMKRVHAEHPEAGGVGGAILGANSDHSMLSRIADAATFPSPSAPGYVRTIAGVNVSYKRSVLQAVGPQDESLFRGEDVDFNWRIRKAGHEIYYTPEIKVVHHHRPTLKALLNQFYMYGRAYYLVRHKWPEMYCVYPRSLTRPRDLAKFAYFIVSTFIDPFNSLMRMTKWIDRILGLPIVYAVHIAWKSGIIVQRLNSNHA